MQYEKRILVTGGAGFIGSHLVRLLVNKYPNYKVVNFDLLSYAGNLANLSDVESKENYHFVKGDVRNWDDVMAAMNAHDISHIIHLAAESHVDRSIENPIAFVETNVLGTVNMLNAAKHFWTDTSDKLFFHISTDEVFGSLGDEGLFHEGSAFDPRSPYSASKASSDHFVRAYHHTYGLPIAISNCSNNYGSHQFPEKLIPLMIRNIKANKELPVYGKGENIRDWLWVEDHVMAMDVILHKGVSGETYAIGGKNEWTNIKLVKFLCKIMDEKLGREQGESEKLIRFVKDRAGHDMRYAIDASKIEKELGWTPSIEFEEGLERTVDWYLNNQDWLDKVSSGEYLEYYERQYGER